MKKKNKIVEAHICRFNDGDCVCECFVAGMKAGKAEQEKLIHIIPTDDSTTIVERIYPSGRHEQTIAGAMLGSKEWERWYEYAQENMLYDVAGTTEIDAMSDKHWKDFITFIKNDKKKDIQK